MKFLAGLVVAILLACAKGWDYNSASNWGTEFPTCNSANQSPIRLGRETSINTFYGWFHYLPREPTPAESEVIMTIRNTGKNIRIDNIPEFIFWGAGLSPKIPYGQQFYSIVYGDLEDLVRYKVDHILIHWGSAKGKGSEHELNGEQLDGEIQIVTYDTRYSSLDEARTKDNGVHIIAHLIKEKADSLPGFYGYFDNLVKSVRDVPYKGDYAFYRERHVGAPFLGFGFLNWYHRYKGSFTTPPCEENVLWSVVDQPLLITPDEMKVFRDLYAEGRDVVDNPRIGDNFRPLQQLNNRKVYYSDFGAYDSYDENGEAIPHPGLL